MGVYSLTFVAQSKGAIMRSGVIGIVIAVFLANTGTVRAASDFDGKALLCTSRSTIHPVYGLVFDQGKVTKHDVHGYSKIIPYKNDYFLVGLHQVKWISPSKRWVYLDRKTLEVDFSSCSLSSEKEIFLKLDEIITAAKTKNKI